MKSKDRIGRTAYIRYRGGAQGGDLIDDRANGDPLPVIIGNGRVPPGVEEALCDMEVGEIRSVEVPSEKGYGSYNANAVQWYPRSILKQGYDLKRGSVVVWNNPEDHVKRPGRVVEETKDAVKIDLNHPFAGKNLEYRLELVMLV